METTRDESGEDWAEVLGDIQALKAECRLLIRIAGVVDEIEQGVEPEDADLLLLPNIFLL